MYTYHKNCRIDFLIVAYTEQNKKYGQSSYKNKKIFKSIYNESTPLNPENKMSTLNFALCDNVAPQLMTLYVFI